MAAQKGGLSKWLHLKQYQLELTYSVYMFTPWEKFAFCTSSSSLSLSLNPSLTPTDSIFFLLFSLVFIAALLYLPHHISFIVGRAWYYFNGEHIDVASAARDVVEKVSASVLQETGTAEEIVETVGAVVREL